MSIELDGFKLQLKAAKKAQDLLTAKYGDPRSPQYQNLFCMVWKANQDHSWLPVVNILINKDFKVIVQKFFRLLEARGLTGEVKKWCGCYDPRKSRTTNLLSLHYWAAAIDMNCNIERLGRTTTSWSKEFLACAKEAGLYWGGDFIHTKDPMHFAIYNG